MEPPHSDFRRMAVEEFDTSKLLAHASKQARDRGYDKFPIVDVDSHHYENESLAEILEYMDDPVLRQLALAGSRPTPMLALGVHPQVEVEVALSRAYNRWLCERVLAREPRLVSMLYLPFNDPEATFAFVKEFGEKKGVVGFLITSTRYRAVHNNAYMKTYARIWGCCRKPSA